MEKLQTDQPTGIGIYFRTVGLDFDDNIHTLKIEDKTLVEDKTNRI